MTCEHCTAPVSGDVALFGGAFDPPHLGHVAVADAAAEAVGQVWWLPTGQPLHRAPSATPAGLRVAMVDAAAAHDPRQRVCTADMVGERSATVDLVARLSARHPHARFHLVVGADQAAALPTWHRADDLLQAVDLLVAARPGHPLPEDLPPGTRLLTVAVIASSTDVRAGHLELLPPAVAALWCRAA